MSADPDRISILCVDDNVDLADLTATSLERHDARFSVTTATSARDALERVASMDVDCIVSDYEMPEMNGLELLDAVREGTPDLPFIVFTGKGSEEIASDAITRGATDYLQKGGGTEQYEILANRVANSVAKYRLTKQERAAEKRYRSLFENSPIVIWEEDYSASKQELDALVEAVDDVAAHLEDNPDVVRRLMSKIEVIDVNENALAYYGAPSKEVLMDNLEQVFTDDALESMREMWVALAAGERNFRWETVGQTLDGERKHELIGVHIPEEYSDDFSRVYVTSMDISDRKQQERELQRRTSRLEEFASVVSHDLRNPLNVAEGRLEMARSECESEHLGAVAESLDQMETLIEELLALARTDEEVLAPEPVALRTLAEECWRHTDTADATLVLETDRTIHADRRRTQQLLENLVRNAVEHGGEDVTVTVGDCEGGFFVADDGPGLPDGDAERVLQRGVSTAADGTGLGLYIVTEIVDSHGWDVAVREGRDGGARFEITVDTNDA